MKAKEYLTQAFRLDNRINSKIDQIASLNDLATKCTSRMVFGLPGTGRNQRLRKVHR